MSQNLSLHAIFCGDFNELPDDERMNGSERAMDILAVLRVLQARLAEDAMEITKRIKNKTLVIK